MKAASYSKSFIVFCSFFTLGIALGAYLNLDYQILFPLCGINTFCLIAFLFLSITRGDKYIFFVCFWLGLLCSLSAQIIDFPQIFELSRIKELNTIFNDKIEQIAYKDSRITALAQALLTGNKTQLDQSLVQVFRKAGAAHILALSGLHFGIIYLLLKRALSFLNFRRKLLVIKSIIIMAISSFYTIITGAGPSVVRAYLFALINEILKFCPERKGSLINVLCLALMIQVLFKPLIIKSLAFELSYLAILGICIIYPRLKAFYTKDDSIMYKIWDVAALSISCQITTFPLVWIYFRSFPIFFIITNLIALPLTTAFIISCLLCLGLNSIMICPQIIKDLSENIAQVLIFCLEAIAAL